MALFIDKKNLLRGTLRLIFSLNYGKFKPFLLDSVRFGPVRFSIFSVRFGSTKHEPNPITAMNMLWLLVWWIKPFWLPIFVFCCCCCCCWWKYCGLLKIFWYCSDRHLLSPLTIIISKIKCRNNIWSMFDINFFIFLYFFSFIVSEIYI